jgi:hypothetical protein
LPQRFRPRWASEEALGASDQNHKGSCREHSPRAVLTLKFDDAAAACVFGHADAFSGASNGFLFQTELLYRASVAAHPPKAPV